MAKTKEQFCQRSKKTLLINSVFQFQVAQMQVSTKSIVNTRFCAVGDEPTKVQLTFQTAAKVTTLHLLMTQDHKENNINTHRLDVKKLQLRELRGAGL